MTAAHLLSVDGLGIFAGGTPLLKGLSFGLGPGDALVVLGESGAGKSLLIQAVMGILPTGLRAEGRVTLMGQTSLATDAAQRRHTWGRSLALLPQEPGQALDPLMKIGPQLAEVYEQVDGQSAESAGSAASQALDGAGLASARTLYPWQISGGMAQRAAATMATAGGAQVLLADEPTKGLDVHWREAMVKRLQELLAQGGCLVVVTHDLGVAKAVGGQVIVLRAGEVVEQGRTAAVLAAPSHPFTRQVIAADPAGWPDAPVRPHGDLVVEARQVSKGYRGNPLFSGLDLTIGRAERWTLQGPSGTGKSTLGNLLLGLTAPDAGTVQRADGLAPTALQKLYQDPQASFAPRLSLREALRDVARLHRQPWSTVVQTVESLGLNEGLLLRQPHQVSGGELQRVALARVLITRPAFLFADEPTSRLDPVTQQEALDVLARALDQAGTALLLVTHDPDLARAMGDRQIRLALVAHNPQDHGAPNTMAERLVDP